MATASSVSTFQAELSTTSILVRTTCRDCGHQVHLSWYERGLKATGPLFLGSSSQSSQCPGMSSHRARCRFIGLASAHSTGDLLARLRVIGGPSATVVLTT